MAIWKVDGALIASPSEIQVEFFEVGSGERRSASGVLLSDCVAVKRRLTLRWAHIAQSALEALMRCVGADGFEAVYPDPIAGTRKGNFRCKEASAGVLRMIDDAPVWVDVCMEWTER